MNYKNKTNDVRFIFLTTVLSLSVYMLSFCHKIAQCSLIFLFAMLTSNLITEFYGKKSAIKAIGLSTLLNIVLLWNFEYRLGGVSSHVIILVSLFSVFISASGSIYLLKENAGISFYKRNFVSLAAAALIDGVIMSAYYLNIFSINKILSIFISEIMFKSLYISGMSVILYSLGKIRAVRQFNELRRVHVSEHVSQASSRFNSSK